MPKYQKQYEDLSKVYGHVYDSIKDLPEIQVTERFGKETHITMQTPLTYMLGRYGSDAEARSFLFAKIAQGRKASIL